MTVPVTAFYAALAALLWLWLTALVIRLRRRLKVGVGDGGHPALQRAIRVQGNACETLPLALLLMLLLELNGAGHLSLHIFGAVLLLARVLHAFGLSRYEGRSPGRFWGTVGTLVVVLAMAAANLFLYVQHS